MKLTENCTSSREGVIVLGRWNKHFEDCREFISQREDSRGVSSKVGKFRYLEGWFSLK